MTIGRAKDNRLVVNEAMVSSHHAEIRPSENGYSLTDAGSTNGTLVNGRKLERYTPYDLQDGDRIFIGSTTYVYQAGGPDLRGQLIQEGSQDDEITRLWQAPAYKANDVSEKWAYQAPASYATYASRQQHAPVPFPPASQWPYTPPPAMNASTGYSIPAQQPPPVPFPPAYTPPPVQPKSRNRLKVLLIVLSAILILGAGAGAAAAYMLTRPQPVMSITSSFKVGSIPAGSTGTVLHVSARSFSGSSAITFLLDNAPVASGQNVSSDASGNVRADLTITTSWAVGNHTLTARDAGGYATKAGVTVAIVPQGQAHTPGPNGAPPDAMSFTLNANVQYQDAGTGKQLGSSTETLMITGKPDPSGGTVCRSIDDGQTHTDNGTTSNGATYQETYVSSCSGTYKGGKLTYIETVTTDKVVYSNGVSCMAGTPYVAEHLEGTFTSQNAISGTLTADSITWNCNQGVGTQQTNASKGSWTAQM
jgi:hypothetical protein